MVRTALFIAFISVLPASAQKPGAASAPAGPRSSSTAAAQPTREEILQLFNALDIRQQLGSVADVMKGNMEKMQEAQMPDLTDAQKQKISDLNSEIVGEAFNQDSVNAMLEDLVPIYQKHFTRADIQAVMAFYNSPSGRKFLHEQPQILQDTMTTAVAHLQQRIEKIMTDRNYDGRMRLILAGKAPPSPKRD